MIHTEDLNPKQKLISFYSILMLFVLVFCCGLLALDARNKNEANVIADESTTSFVSDIGSVQGVETTSTPIPTLVVNQDNSPAKYTVNMSNPFNSNTSFVLQGKLTAECLNLDGNFCTGELTRLTSCDTNNCSVGDSITLKPDSYNSWRYEVSKGLSTGNYTFSIRDLSGKKVQDIIFIVK